MHRYVLYGTLGCHLCEDAEVLLRTRFPQIAAALVVTDIADSDDLVKRYGIRIPVLKREAGDSELNWPFDADAVAAWLEEPI